MKTLTRILTAILILSNICFANEMSYKLNITNLNYTSERTLEFDIYLLNANPEKTGLNYSLGQYFLEFNSSIANGGTLTYSIVSSALPENMKPRNPSVFENQLRLACNSINSVKDNLPVIPNEAPGLLIVRMKLETSANKFSSEPVNLKWTDGSSKHQTKIFSFNDNKNIELTNSKSNTLDILNKSDMQTQKITGPPTEYSLSQNFPNPFNPTTKISYELPITNLVTLKVYDITGKEIATLVNERLNAGRYEVIFNGNNFASGVYFFRINAGDFSRTMRMILIK